MAGYGTLPTVGERKARLEVGRLLVLKAVIAMGLCSGLLVALSVRRSGGEVVAENSLKAKDSDDLMPNFANAQHMHNAAWSCSDFDDDRKIDPEECGSVDKMMCADHCVSRWCLHLCGGRCAQGEGALCAYERLADLSGTCASVRREMARSNASLSTELELAEKSNGVEHGKCRPLADIRVTDPKDGAKIDPRNDKGYPVCDHHAWCSFCRGSESCERVVPKARAPERVESGGCAASSLGRIVSICSEAGYMDDDETERPSTTLLRKIYYINCDESTDRRALQESQLTRLGVPFERFACVSGDSIDEVLASRAALDSGALDKDMHPFLHNVDEQTRARTIGTWLSHYTLFERIARVHADDPDGLYLVLEDDAVLDPRFSVADVDRVSMSLPGDWAYASLNVHESYCLEDRVNEDWFVKRAKFGASLYDSERVSAGKCTPATKDAQWRDNHILYLSAAASLLRPATAVKVTEWLDKRPLYHIDAVLRTPNATTFPSFQFQENLFYTSNVVPESRRNGHRAT